MPGPATVGVGTGPGTVTIDNTPGTRAALETETGDQMAGAGLRSGAMSTGGVPPPCPEVEACQTAPTGRQGPATVAGIQRDSACGTGTAQREPAGPAGWRGVRGSSPHYGWRVAGTRPALPLSACLHHTSGSTQPLGSCLPRPLALRHRPRHPLPRCARAHPQPFPSAIRSHTTTGPSAAPPTVLGTTDAVREAAHARDTPGRGRDYRPRDQPSCVGPHSDHARHRPLR